ncbi:MAG: sigma 54-interacting transcriptional regulator [Deltaproteobacteria bacterium]|nr:sigma 54-interacting transcriptional regulator [Deltaproteobacteria bacterium]
MLEQEPQTQLLKTADDGSDAVTLRKCQLVVLQGVDKGKKISLHKNSTTIGKRETNDFVLSDKTVSRTHVAIDYTADSFVLRDLGSTNGSYLNGSRVKEAYLAPGDVIKMGNTQIEFRAFDEKVKVAPSSNEQFGLLVGTSLKMRQIFGILERIAPTNASVIVEGETGTGKDLVAQSIHEHSARRSRPFVVFDCSAVAPNLIESELFGHEKGAFTGAIKSRRGAFEEAHGGTIFLDEIGELTAELQPKLLRALEQRQVKRVGGNTTINIDVRIICATNKNLRTEVTEGRFREDLYYRLSVVKIIIPPVRERPEDIPALIEHILRDSKFNRGPEGGLRVTRIDDDALKLLQRYQWPGNVRELVNTLERATSFVESETITRGHIDFVFSHMEHEEEGTERLVVDKQLPFKEAKQRVLEVFEKDYLQDLLDRNNGNLSAAAREAGIDRKHIRNLLKKYGINAKE